MQYDPANHIIVRDFARTRDMRMDRVLRQVRDLDIDMFEVDSPYAAGLRAAGESWNPSPRAINVADVPDLHRWADGQPVPDYTKPVVCTWVPNDPTADKWAPVRALHNVEFEFGAYTKGAGHRWPEYVFRPPLLFLDASGTANTRDFLYLPALTLSGNTLRAWVHRRARFDEIPQSVNGIPLRFAYETGLSPVPGTALNTGVYVCTLSDAEKRAVLGDVDSDARQTPETAEGTPAPPERQDQQPEPQLPPAPEPAPVWRGGEPEPEPQVIDEDELPNAPTVVCTWTTNGAFQRAEITSADGRFHRADGRPLLVMAPGRRLKAWGDDLAGIAVINGEAITFEPRQHDKLVVPNEYFAILDAAEHDAILNPPRTSSALPLTIDIEEQHKVFAVKDVEKLWHDLGVGMRILLIDRDYIALPVELWYDITVENDVDTEIYVPERFDCDDFAFAFKGEMSRQWEVNGVGIVMSFSAGHAFVALLTVERTGGLGIRFMEPQTDGWVDTTEPSYDLDQGLVIF